MKKLSLLLIISCITIFACKKEKEEESDPPLRENYFILETEDRTFQLKGKAVYEYDSSPNKRSILITLNGEGFSGICGLTDDEENVWSHDTFNVPQGSPSGQWVSVNILGYGGKNYYATNGTVTLTSKKEKDHVTGNVSVTLMTPNGGTEKKVSGYFNASAE